MIVHLKYFSHPVMIEWLNRVHQMTIIRMIFSPKGVLPFESSSPFLLSGELNCWFDFFKRASTWIFMSETSIFNSLNSFLEMGSSEFWTSTSVWIIFKFDIRGSYYSLFIIISISNKFVHLTEIRWRISGNWNNNCQKECHHCCNVWGFIFSHLVTF